MADTPKTPEELHGHWKAEFKAAREALKKWHDQGDKIDRIVRDERDAVEQDESRWNLYTANLETKEAMLYGRTPQVSVDRRHADQNDDVGRVAGDIMARLLNTDIERKSDGCRSAYRYALKDRLGPGWGLVRSRYVVEWEDVPEVPAKVAPDGTELAPPVPATKRKAFEDVETDYIHWKDQLWQPCRFFHEMGWWAHKSQMTRAALVKRFGPEQGARIPLKGKDPSATEESKRETDWDRADVWEIWDKDDEQVHWMVEDYGVLETKPDPYELDGFWPFPQPMVANVTTSKLVPRPDYVIAQDLYSEVNEVSGRIKALVKAVKVRGAYDKSCPELAAVLDAKDGDMVPVANWGAFAEKGGLKGAADFFDVIPVVNAIIQLRDYRRELVDMIGQVTGMSDLMRGEATRAGEDTATLTRAKARVGSVRMQFAGDDFARFASEHQGIRGQLIAKFFDPETILERCNSEFSTDKELIPAALELIKSPKFSQYRIEVKPEAVSLTDFSALKAERMEILGGVSGAFNAFAPIAQSMPAAMPFLLQIGQWAIAGMRGSSQLESAFDKAIQAAEAARAQAEANPQAAPPDPKLQAEQIKAQVATQKGQFDIQKEQLKHQNKLAELQAETQAHDLQEQSQARWNTVEATQKGLIARSLKPAEPPKSRGLP